MSELTDADRRRVAELLGREPGGAYEIVVRNELGDPVVLCNAPLLESGRPMPTRYWLVGDHERRIVGRIESDGGACGVPRPRFPQSRSKPLTSATDSNATLQSRRITTVRDRPPASAAPAAASSACTPTTPGISQAATIQ